MCGGGGGEMQGPNPYELELVNQAERRLAEYNEMYKPMEESFLQDTQTMNNDWFRQGMADNAVATARSQFAPFGVQAGQANQIKTQFAGGSQVLAKASAMAGAQGYQAADNLYDGRMMDYIGMGRGQTDTTMNLYGQTAGNQAGLNAAKAQASQTSQSGMYNALGTAAGFGFGAASEKYDWFKPSTSQPTHTNPLTPT